MQQTLMLNSIPISLPAEELEIPFYKYKHEVNNFYPVFIKDVLAAQVAPFLTNLEKQDTQYIYTDFEAPTKDAMLFKVSLSSNEQLADHYCTAQLLKYFKQKADVVLINFVGDVEVWYVDEEHKATDYKYYHRYSFPIQFLNGQPSLVIAYNGTKKIYNQSVADIQKTNFDTTKYKKLRYKNELYHWDDLSQEAKLNLHQVFPILSKELITILKPKLVKVELNPRYNTHFDQIGNFYLTHLNNEAFRSYLNIGDSFNRRTADAKGYSIIEPDANVLEYGGGNKGNEPKYDMPKYGPYLTIEKPANVKIFFIYSEADKPQMLKLKGYFDNGCNGAQGLFDYSKMPFSYIEEWDIEFKNTSDIIRAVFNQVEKRKKEPNVKYLAVYISPIKKDTLNFEQKRIYYRLKEMLITYGYQSQVVYNYNINSTSFNYFLPNIFSAMLAKLGGVPWRLSREPSKELVVGIGASHSKGDRKGKFLGSAFCFDNVGRFQNFDCFPAQYIEDLSGSIRKAVGTFLDQNSYYPDRLIIHFYKQMSKKEIKVIMQELYNLKADCPIIIVTINKTESSDLLAFDIDDRTNLMPYSGTYLEVAERQYLLFNNTRYTPTSTPGDKEYHFPVKLKITSHNLELLEDPAVINLLIDQVYQFSRMYWKAVKQQNLPVTLMYPEMISEMFPFFRYPALQGVGKNSLWFL